jgi:FkbM family methyltransferase
MQATLNGTLEDWLEAQLVSHAGTFMQRPTLLDIGAYHGDFTARFLGDGKFRKAILFEPNPKNLVEIKKRFVGQSHVIVENAACDTQPGERDFFCAGETYTGSLLPYGTPTPTPVERSVVQCVTLDSYLNDHQALDKIGLLKIDTQGNDLHVLQGGEAMLRASRPWIVVELIYVPLYESQGHPHELALWLATRGYTMAAQFNEYYTGNGWLAWSDACFIPKELTGKFPEIFLGRPQAPPPNHRHRFWRRLFHH